MSEWWSVVAVFWTLYLADGVSGGRREQLFLSSWRGEWRWRFWPRLPRPRSRPPRTAHLTQAGWFVAPPFPWAYTLALDDLPASIASEGLTNWPSASTSRPPPRPDRTRTATWENAGKISTGGAWITLGGERFAPVTNALDARALRGLAERLTAMTPEQRAAEITFFQNRRFSVLRARRRIAIGLARTRTLAWMNTLQTIGWIALSFALVRGAFDPALPFGLAGSWRWLEPEQIRWWVLSGWLFLMHLLALGTAWRLHGKLHPRRKDERANLIFSALLLPAQALRLRAALLRPLAHGMAPMAAVLAVGTPATARAAAAATLRDLDFPARPSGLPASTMSLNESAAALCRPALVRALAEASADGVTGLRAEELLAPPANREAGVCAFCPRCGDGFLRSDGVCPQGVKLREFDSAGSNEFSETLP
jgi:hypothetical protein